MNSKKQVKYAGQLFEDLSHGETLTKFIAKDEPEATSADGDFTVEIHGFVKEDGSLIVTHEFVDKTNGERANK